ncbi:MAG: hypothetical protein JOZ78_23170 [Chroococcidiopsidaceae cyanobacterium CP_BM_ER_R8_30]|nr:hypothetical protein [Chroococcidiopsidaceae cyanobacterium CP_BM_ER_R8_30]
MPVNQFKALLVEGIPGIGKSTLLDALLRQHVDAAQPRRIRTLLHLAQSHTHGPLASAEDTGTLTVSENQQHLERIVSIVEWFHACVQEQTIPKCFVLIDCLHLTHCVRPGVVTWSDVAGFDRRLAALGCKLLFLQVSLETIWDRSIVARADWQFIRVYAAKFGKTHEELHRYFQSEQEQIASMFEQSAMPKLLLQNDGRLEDVITEAERFWLEGFEGEQ